MTTNTNPKPDNEIKIPLTIVTGFLGSGKSTLINLILDHLVSLKQKVAIIQNEFADSGVEDAFITDSENNDSMKMVELANGCVCCTVRNNFELAVEQLASSNKYDYIILECSGMADPSTLISMFWIDEQLEASIYLDGVISVVDAKYFEKFLLQSPPNNNKNENKTETENPIKSQQIVHQIAYADKILLNKQDLILTKSNLNKIKTLIQNVNHVGDIFITTRSKLNDCSAVLNIRAYDTKLPPNFDKLKASQKATHTGNSIHEVDQLLNVFDGDDQCSDKKCTKKHAHTESACAHDLDITSLMFDKMGVCVDFDKLDQWLSELLWEDNYGYYDQSEKTEQKQPASMQIFRMKAILPNQNGNNHYLSVVQELYEVEQGSTKWDKSGAICRMVVIGKHLNYNILKSGFESIFLDKYTDTNISTK